MILVICPKCAFSLRILGETDEVHQLVGQGSEFWPDHYTCPRCGATAQGCVELEVPACDLDKLAIRDLTAFEALAAFHGLGLPNEQVCTKALLETLLREQPVRRIGARDITGSHRCYLHHIELWDGTKIYLGAAPGGAVVYRIASSFSYVEKATP